MLPAGCSRRLLAELRDALDACAERQRQLERSLRVSRRLLRVWEPAETPALEPTPGPDTNEEARPPARTPSPQDLKELELLTQALEKAIRVRKGLSKAGGRDEAPSRKSRSIVSPATTASVPPRASGQAGRRASETKPPRGVRQTTVPAKGLPELRLLSVGDQTCKARGAQAAKPEPGLRDQQIAPSAAPQAPEAFTLKQKGILLRLPMAFRKAASQNSRRPAGPLLAFSRATHPRLGPLPWLALAYLQRPSPAGGITVSLSGSRGTRLCIPACGPNSALQRPVTPWMPLPPPRRSSSGKCRLAQLQALCCRGGGRGGAPAEGLLTAEAANGGRAHSRPSGLDAGVPLPAHPGGAAGHCRAVSPQATGTACSCDGTPAGAMA
ncbi:tubulin epsilon and delta complex protein 2 isoform X6 [Equus asinus]|uniref:tubulin epsilon and delta complex protein 2 isoform X6 n=1 Tax=Equus asinus TaxID=9793 RepID=UPI0038F5FBC3